MNILVAGHSVVDKIIDRDKISVKPGGIFYSVVALLSQMKSNDNLYLCSNIDKNSESLFKAAYDKVHKDFLAEVNSIPQVELVINETGERKETYSLLAKHLSLPYNDLRLFDGLLINMISGYDITLEQLQQLRKVFNGLIYFDVHTLSRGVDRNMDRVFRKIEHFSDWAESIDILQVNESELLTLSVRLDEMEIVEELISFGISQIIITKADKGATVYYEENDVIKKYHKDAVKVDVVNIVGCGDVFGAVYFYNYIKNKNVILALEQANLFAGISTTITSAEEFLNLKRYANEWISKK